MVITTHQPIFLPWPGFFWKALHCDAMVLLDDVQFPLGRSWLTRNRVKSDQGELWLAVPVWRRTRGMQIVRNVEICDETNWRARHLRSMRQWYAHAPYLQEFLPAIESVYSLRQTRLVELNVELIRNLWQVFRIRTRLFLQSDLGVSGQKSDLLISICRHLSADTYITLPPAKKYLEPEKFSASDIRIRIAKFDPPVYPQLWGNFRHNLSALDLLLNCGPKAKEILSRASARVQTEPILPSYNKIRER